MAELTFKSAGVSSRELDLSGATATEPVGIPAAVISPTQMGPAFVPMIQPTEQDYQLRFGGPNNDISYGPLAASEWLRTQQSLVQLRVLGVGNGTKRTTSGNGAGKVTSAGFVVGTQQPQSTLSGALGHNTYANTVSSAPNASGSVGRAYLLGCFMSQSAGSTFLTDASLSANGTPLVRGIILAASGVVVTLSSSNVISTVPAASTSADIAVAATIKGTWTGSVNLNSGRQEFIMFFNGHKGTDPLYPNFVTASFDTVAPNYFATIFNKDPLKLEQAGYVLYSHYDIHSAQAVPTGSGIVIASSGSAAFGGYENVAFVITGSQTTNSGSANAPNFEGFEDRYQTPSTPWVTSQNFGGNPANLFKVWNLSDGDTANTQVKVSIEGISPSNNTVNLYGTFDLIVRAFSDTDANKVVLEQWRGLSLDPSSPKYIARVIGDTNTFFNFDVDEPSQKLQSTGEFPVRSRFIRVEMSDAMSAGSVPATALPVGFRGHQHLVTSGSAPLPSITNAVYYTKSNVLWDVVQPPVPFRINLAKGSSTTLTANKTLYWGVQFEQVTSSSEPNANTAPNKSMSSLTKYLPNYNTVWQDVVVKANEGTADTAANAVLDADRFNNNAFSLEKIRLVLNSSTGLPDLNNLSSWAYVRAGGLTTTSTTRALTVADLLDPGIRSIAKFTFHMEGGFDGVRPFDANTKYLTNQAVVEEMANATRGFSAGPTVKSYLKAINIISDTSELDIQLLTIPGIRHRYVTDTAMLAMQNDRFDCFYIFDLEERDVLNNLITDTTTQDVSVRFTASNFRSRGLNSSFAATYFPDVVLRDSTNRTVKRVPPSVAVLGAFGKNDAVGYPWYAPAGFTRGALDSVQEAAMLLSRGNMDDLYSVNVNPIVAFPGQVPTVWGQKTVLASQSALERVNVRRLLLSLRRDVKKVSNRIMFEPLRADTLSAFASLVSPILKRVQDQGGLDNFKVDINTSTTTQADIENKTIRGKIFLIPTRTLEFLSLDFVLTNRGTIVS